MCGYVQHPEIKSLGPNGEKCKPHTRGLLRRMTIDAGLQLCIGKEVSRFEQSKEDFINNIDDECIHYDGGRVAANETLIAEISARGLRRTTMATGLDRKTIRRVVSGKQVNVSTLGKIVIGLRGADIQFVTDGLGINASAFVTKPSRSKKKGEPRGSRFFLMIANAIENAPAVDAGNPLLLVSVGALNSAIDKNTRYFQLRSRTCIRNTPLFLRHLKAIG